jgi:hypothetical protein
MAYSLLRYGGIFKFPGPKVSIGSEKGAARDGLRRKRGTGSCLPGTGAIRLEHLPGRVAFRGLIGKREAAEGVPYPEPQQVVMRKRETGTV